MPDRPEITTSSRDLLERVRGGDERAASSLFRRQADALRKWAHGRLPRWARGWADTADLVQEAVLQTFRWIDRFEDRGKGALQAYLRQAVMNRIRDEVRKVGRRPLLDSEETAVEVPAPGPSAFDRTLDAEHERKYKAALSTLGDDERLLIVGRVELGYNYEQLALISNKPTPEAARLAVRRAVLKLAQRMSGV